MKEENQIIECPECEGEGTIYIDTSSSCSVYPIGECCGGCGHDRECEDCGGSGEVEVDENGDLI
jgi:DnaJ-class molecular chaperone